MNRARFEIYRDAAGGWRWRLRAPNGRIIADSAEAYSRRCKADEAARRLSLYSCTGFFKLED